VIVADTDLVSFLLIEGERTEAARGVWRRDPEWRLPPLWRSEFLNVLTISQRASVLTEASAFRIWDDAVRLFGRNEHEPRGTEVLQAAIDHGLSAYDAHFVVVAKTLGAPLVTGDQKILKACHQIAVGIEELADSG